MTFYGHIALNSVFTPIWWAWEIVVLEVNCVRTNIKTDPHCPRRKCLTGSVVSGNIKFVWIFLGVPWRGGVKWQRSRALRAAVACTLAYLNFIRYVCNKCSRFIGHGFRRWRTWVSVITAIECNRATKTCMADALFLSGSWASCLFWLYMRHSGRLYTAVGFSIHAGSHYIIASCTPNRVIYEQ